LPDVAVRHDVIGIAEIELVNVLLWNELVDFEGVLAVDGDGFELFWVELDVLALPYLIALDDVLLCTSSPVSASILRYLTRLPVSLLSWWKLIFSRSDVAGNSEIGHETRDSFR
jgi:hypothetical protein